MLYATAIVRLARGWPIGKIAAIYQQLALFPDLTVAENIALGLEPGGWWRPVRWRRRRERAKELLARAGSRLSELSPRERETVETLTTQIVNKLLHAPTVRAKEAGSEPLRDLFALRDDE